jgi:hypothetical protein
MIYNIFFSFSFKEEQKTSLELLQRIHEYHEDWLISAHYPLPAPVNISD